MDQVFLSGPRLQTHENPGKTSWRKQWRTTHKDLWLSSPTVNLLCRSDTAFIYCLYLFIGQLNMASCALAWSGLTICLRRLGGCCWQFVCGFSMLSRVGGKKTEGSEFLWLEYWTTVPFLPNRMCSKKAFGAFSAFILHFDCLLLFHKTSTHIQSWKPTCSHHRLTPEITHKTKQQYHWLSIYWLKTGVQLWYCYNYS